LRQVCLPRWLNQRHRHNLPRRQVQPGWCRGVHRLRRRHLRVGSRDGGGRLHRSLPRGPVRSHGWPHNGSLHRALHRWVRCTSAAWLQMWMPHTPVYPFLCQVLLPGGLHLCHRLHLQCRAVQHVWRQHLHRLSCGPVRRFRWPDLGRFVCVFVYTGSQLVEQRCTHSIISTSLAYRYSSCGGIPWVTSRSLVRHLCCLSGLCTTHTGCSGSCAAGYVCPAGSPNATVTLCGAGTFSIAGSSPPCTPCAAGRYGATTGLPTAACSGQCLAGYYGATTGLTLSTCTGPCTPGYACPAGSANGTATLCAAGSFAAAGAGACTPCAAGLYGNVSGLTSAACSGQCAPGTYGATAGLLTSMCTGLCTAG
jgi:hypothetical protein